MTRLGNLDAMQLMAAPSPLKTFVQHPQMATLCQKEAFVGITDVC
jgi:hypothetical protein